MRRSRAQNRSWWRFGVPALVTALLVAFQPVPARAADPVSITALSPAVAAAGATVAVTGAGFSATAAQNAVTVNGKAATVSAATATQLTVALPTGVTSGPVRVVSPAGSATSPSDVYVPPTGFAVADVEQTRRLAYGAETVAAVATSGKIALLTIAGQVGHRLSLKLAASTFGGSTSNARATIYRPDGTALVAATGFPTAGVLLGPVVLPADGTYQVLIDPQSTAVGQVAVTAYDLPADVELSTTGAGTAVVMTNTVPGQNAVLSFPATVGQRFFFAFSDGTFSSLSNAKVTVRQPDGTALIAATNCGTSCELDTTVAPVAGTYSVLFDPQAALTGSLTARVYSVPADAAATLAVGGAAQTVTTTPGQNAVLSFPGTTGNRVYFTFADGTYGSLTDATVTVRRPDGSSFVSAVTCGTACTIDVQTLPVTGTYTILLDPRDAATGSLTARLTAVAADSAATLTAGGPAQTVATTTAGQNATFSFAGTVGQRIFLNFTGGTFASSTQAKVTVLQPDGTALVSAVNCGQSCVLDTRSLSVAGAYTVLVDPQGAMTGSLTAQLYQVPADLVATATAGGPAQQVLLATPGQNASVTFAAEAGQRISIQLSGSTFGTSATSASVTVLKPDGTALHTATGLGSSGLLFGPTTMPASGTYTVTVNPAGALTGAVAVRVFSVADATVSTTPGGPAVTVTTGTPGQNATVTFPGTAGQRVGIRLSGSTYGASSASLQASVLAPDGTVFVAAAGVSGNGSFIDARVLPATGTYTLLLDPRDVLTGSVVVEVFDVPADLTAALSLDGTLRTVATTVPGQNMVISFTGAAGRKVSLRFTNGAGTIYGTLRRPDGTDLKARWAIGSSDFVDPVTLPADGVYTLLLDPNTAALGSIDVAAWDVPVDPTATGAVNGPAATATTTVPGQNAAITVSGTAGRRVSLRLTGPTSTYATITAPDGTDLKARWLAGSSDFVEPVTLPATGDYVVRLDPLTYGVGAFTVQAWEVPADNAYQAALDGTPIVAAVTVPGQNATVTFPGAAGHRLSFQLTGTVGVYLTLRKPDGTDLKARWNAGSIEFLDPLVLPDTGTYTLLLDPTVHQVGAMTVRLRDVPADPATTATLGGPEVESNIVVPGQNATVRFTGATGDSVFVLLDSIGFSSVTVTLVDPAGTTLSSVTLTGTTDRDDLGPIVLTTAGTYTLRIDPYDATTGVLRTRVYGLALPAPVAASTDGKPTPVALGLPGQYGRVTFSGTAGQRVSIVSSGDFRDGTAQGVYTTSLLSTSGATLGQVSPSTSAPRLLGPITLPATGSYEVRVNPALGAVGSATVRIYDVSQELVLDSAAGTGLVALELPAAGMTAVLRFPAAAGQAIALDYVDGPGGTFRGALSGPSGSIACSGSTVTVTALTTCTTGDAGTYEFRLTGLGPEVGTWHMELIDAVGTPVVSLANKVYPGGWVADRAVTGTLAAAAVTPLAGYSAVVDANPGTVPPATVTHPGPGLSLDLPAEGTSYLHVRAVAANGVAGPTQHHLIKADWTGPAVTSLEVPSHPDPDKPNGALALSARYTSGPDLSGVVGYAVSVTHGATDAASGAPRPGGSYETTLPAEGDWYLHVAAVDMAGNRGTSWHRKLTVDTPPDAPVISSATHPVPGTAYPTQDFVATWTGTRTAWARTWAVGLDHTPDTVPGVASASTETRYSARLAAGEWWLHVRGVDVTGTPGATAHLRVVVDAPANRFSQPRAGQTVWGRVPVVLDCTGPLTVQARPAGGAWAAVGTTTYAGGLCTTAWTTAGSGEFALRALSGTDVVAELPVKVANDADVFDRLVADYAAGLLSAKQYLWYALYAALSPGLLPAAYTSGAEPGEPERAFEIYARLFDSLPAADRAEITAWLTPRQGTPPAAAGRSSAQAADDCSNWWYLAQVSYDCRVSTDHFNIVYRSGDVGPTNAGADRPVFVQEVMDGLEQAWKVYHDTMGYKVPDELTVALNPLMPDGSGLSLPTGTMELSSDWNIVTRYLLRHELFHYVQYEYMNNGYFANSWMNWWMEATAEWAAHHVEFHTNDSYGQYHKALGDFLAESDERFDEGNSVFSGGGPEYGAFIVAEYLENRLDPDAVKQTWERLGGYFPSMPGDVILEVLKERRVENDASLELEKFRQFAYVLDANGTQVGFQDSDAATWAQNYQAPREKVTIEETGGATGEKKGSFEIQQSGARYIAIDNPGRITSEVNLSLGSDDGDVRGSVLRLNAAGLPTLACGEAVPVDRAGTKVKLDVECSRAVFFLVNTEPPGVWGTWADVDYTVAYERLGRVLTNGNIDLGFGRFGNIDDPGGVGLRQHGKPETESVLWVCWCEGWGVGVPGGIGGSVTAERGAKNLTVENFTMANDLAISRVRGPGGLTVTHSASPSTDPNLFAIQVNVQNTSSQPITPVRYRRVVDWDLHQLQGYETVQPIGGDTSFVTGVTNNGYADPDPSLPLTDSGINGWYTDNGPGDDGTLIEINLGTLAPGASKLFTLYYGIADSEAAALGSVTGVGAQVYSFGQIKPDGSPFTAMLAIDGSQLVNPPLGPTASAGPTKAATLSPSVRDTATVEEVGG